ncbi:DEAD-box ATP-dependent RNA helicase [Aureococcus anophagefferens]|nr:DEAD-box ATP-dependent RNA helicase [Aureococcus anophagefferens]
MRRRITNWDTAAWTAVEKPEEFWEGVDDAAVMGLEEIPGDVYAKLARGEPVDEPSADAVEDAADGAADGAADAADAAADAAEVEAPPPKKKKKKKKKKQQQPREEEPPAGGADDAAKRLADARAACEQKQERVLAKGPPIVVATPGRLWELVDGGKAAPVRRALEERTLRFLVLDEADRMLEPGAFDELAKLAAAYLIDDPAKPKPKKRWQTLVFSATLALKKDALGKKEKFRKKRNDRGDVDGAGLLERVAPLRSPSRGALEVPEKLALPAGLDVSALKVVDAEKLGALFAILQRGDRGRAVVFTNAIASTRRLATALNDLKVPGVASLHAAMQQRARLKAVDRFAGDARGVLVATDVAARGLDVKGVRTVVHFDVAATLKLFVHRAGRTARAGAAGSSISIVGPKDAAKHAAIAAELERPFSRHDLDQKLFAAALERSKLAAQLSKEADEAARAHAGDRWADRIARDADLLADDDDRRWGRGDAAPAAAAPAKRRRSATTSTRSRPPPRARSKLTLGSSPWSSMDDAGLPGPPPLYGYEPFDPEKWRRPKRTKPSFRSIKTSEYVKLLFQRFEYPEGDNLCGDDDLDLPEMTEKATPEDVIKQLSAADLMSNEDDDDFCIRLPDGTDPAELLRRPPPRPRERRAAAAPRGDGGAAPPNSATPPDGAAPPDRRETPLREALESMRSPRGAPPDCWEDDAPPDCWEDDAPPDCWEDDAPPDCWDDDAPPDCWDDDAPPDCWEDRGDAAPLRRPPPDCWEDHADLDDDDDEADFAALETAPSVARMLRELDAAESAAKRRAESARRWSPSARRRRRRRTTTTTTTTRAA